MSKRPPSSALAPAWVADWAAQPRRLSKPSSGSPTPSSPKRRTAPVTYGDNAVVSDPVTVSASIAREVAGNGSVRHDVLQRALGTSWFLYLRLLSLRDNATGLLAGMTSKCLAKTLPRAGRGEHITENGIRRQLQKLRALGLVENKGGKRRQYYEDPVTRRTRWKTVTDRMVYGATGLGRSDLFAVPYETQLLIEAKPAHGGPRPNAGGKRAGAGRPKGKKTGTGKTRFRRYVEGPPMSAAKLLAATEEVFPESLPLAADISKWGSANSNFGLSIQASLSPLLSSLLFPSKLLSSPSEKKEGAAAPPPVPSLSRDENGIVPKTVSPRVLTEAELAAYRDELAGAGRVPTVSPFVACKHKLFYPFVSVSNHPDYALRIPPPPKLNASDTPERHAYLLMRWYEGATKAVLGKEAGAFKRYRNGPASSPHFGLLKQAALAFIENDIAPAVWCAFSADVWQKMGKKGLPPLRFVFCVDRIVRHANSCRAEEGNWSGGRVLWTPIMRDFAKRQMAMRTVDGSVRSEAQLKRWIERFFPGDLYYELLEHIREDGLRLRDELTEFVERGGWVW